MSKHYTPLRYPGGKQKLTPFIIEILEFNSLIGGVYVEPYAGGAGIAIELLMRNLVSEICLNDSSYPIYAFWKSVISQPNKLCRKIFSASLNVEEWKRRREIVRDPLRHDILEVGFSTFYLNRCNRSGVISGGLIGGLAQTGKWKMDARFTRKELINRIEAIATESNKIKVFHDDAERFILESIVNLPENTLVYCDPPYYEKSRKLYLNTYKKGDHARVAKAIQENIQKKWLVSYDYAHDILREYSKRRAFIYSLRYNASRRYEGKEIFIFSDNLCLPESSSLSCIGNKPNSVLLAEKLVPDVG